jgi:hypothetical protein
VQPKYPDKERRNRQDFKASIPQNQCNRGCGEEAGSAGSMNLSGFLQEMDHEKTISACF